MLPALHSFPAAGMTPPTGPVLLSTQDSGSEAVFCRCRTHATVESSSGNWRLEPAGKACAASRQVTCYISRMRPGTVLDAVG